VVIVLVGFMVASAIYSQIQPDSRGTTPSKDKKNSANFILDDEAIATKEILGENSSKALYNVVVDTFEEAGEWFGAMPDDQGLIISRRVLGAPKTLKDKGTESVNTPSRETNREAKPPAYRKEDGSYERKYYNPIPDEKKYILGVKVDFYKRGNNWFAVYPYRPVPLEGLVKSFQVWVCGRNKNHNMSVIVEDVFGDEKIIPLGKLNFLGWKRMYVNIPDNIKQYDYRFFTKRGLVFKGFLINCDPIESYGKYYLYFDNLSAEVSRFWEEYQDKNDPIDTW